MNFLKKYKEKCSNKYDDQMYLLSRLLIGFMFFGHGAQKLFGLFGGDGGGFSGLMGVAGSIEVVVGFAVFFGLYTSMMSALGSLLMVIAYLMVHAGNGWNPLQNGGEVALLYLAAFSVLTLKGNGKWNLESKLPKNRKK